MLLAATQHSLDMSDTADLQRPPTRRSRWWVLWLGLLVTVLIHLPPLLSDQLRTEGRFAGPDSYTRLQRVVELHTHGQWHNAHTLRANAPFGETLHWTRPLDTILLAGAWLGSAVTEFRDALEMWGTIVSPFLLLLTVAVWRYGTRGFLSDREFLLSLVLLPLLSMFDIAFALGRPDHHSLLNLLFVTGLVLMFRIVTENAPPRLAIVAGLVSGLSIWVSVEAMVSTTYFGASLALLWLWRGQPYLTRTVLFMVGLFAGICGALLIERPPGDWMTPIYDSISVVHWLLAGAGAASWILIAAVISRMDGDSNVRLRLAGVFAGALIPALVIALVFPRFYLGPFADYNAELVNRWLDTIAEYQPLLPISRERAAIFVLQLGPPLIAVIFALFRLRRGDRTERQLMALLLLGFAFYVPLTMATIRWAVYAQALAWLPWTLAALTILNANPMVSIIGQTVRLRTFLAAVFIFTPFLLAVAITPGAQSQSAVGPSCNWRAIATHLEQRHLTMAGREQVLLTDIFRGPALIWSTPYNVVGSPYGNAQSLKDIFGFYGAVDSNTAREIVDRRNIDLVLVCRGSGERHFYNQVGPSTLFTQLTDGASPPWLTAVDLPEPLANSFRLYQVVR
ncbi:MAG: hypothetical protein OER92_03220 [Alphaproteobacteria bacterium]|nr:hypothetical protein [Alphaproteobacteria bacterium]